MRLSQYPKTETLAANSYLITDHPSNGTKAVIPKDLMKNLLSFTDRDMFFSFLDEIATITLRRKIFRGKNLGDSITEEQNEAIKDGSFKGMFVGDYWEIGEDFFVIYDMDYYISSNVPHHLVLSENKSIGKYQMASSESETIGFANSTIYQTVLADYDTKLNGIFSDHCLVVPYPLSGNINTNNQVSGLSPNDKCSCIMSETELYGTNFYTSLSLEGAATLSPFGKFSYFFHRGYLDLKGKRIWLRNGSHYSKCYYCIFEPDQLAPNTTRQINSNDVWPIFTIKGV